MKNIKTLISNMSVEDKARLLAGADNWHTAGYKNHPIPQIMMTDGPHGLRKMTDDNLIGLNSTVKTTCFPPACASACSWDERLIESMGEAIAEECKEENVSIILGPGANIKRSPLCGRNFEYFSEDPLLAGKMAAGFIRGVESLGIGTSLKHFAANNQEYNRMVVSAEIDERTLREIYLRPFEIAVKEGKPTTLMCAYNKINGTYCSENKKILNDILREEWGFDGIVMSDWGAVDNRVEGIKAGLELEMPYSGTANEERIVQAIRRGELSEEVLNRACERMLKVIFKGHSAVEEEYEYDRDAHNELSCKIACESAVLLKNEGILPLNEGEKILIVGELAKIPRYQGGGSSHITPTVVSNLIDSLAELGINADYEQGYSIKSGLTDRKLLARAVEKAKNYDKVVLYVGLTDEYETEGKDRADMKLPPAHSELIDAVTKVNRNVAILLAAGSAIEMPWAEDVKAILMMYLAGGNGGMASAKLLYGRANPCGKLAESYPYKLEDTSCYRDFNFDKYQTFYTEGIYVGYRYYTSAGVKVRYPFGYGMSYSAYEYSDAKITETPLKDEHMLSVSLKVKNVGDMDGKEIVQLYVAKKDGKVFRPNIELKGFTKVEVKANESAVAQISLDRRAFTYYDTQKNDWILESGEYELLIGASCEDIRCRLTIEIEDKSTDTVSINYDSSKLDWYYNPTAGGVPFEQYETLNAKKYDKVRPSFKRGNFTTKNSLDEMALTSFLARRVIGIAGFVLRSKLKTDKKDTAYIMMKEIFISTPVYKLSAASQGAFSPAMAEGVVDIFNGKRIQGIKKLMGK